MPKEDNVVGFDLGTTNSAVAYVNEAGDPCIIPNSEGKRTTPSVVAFHGKNNEEQLVGDVAKRQAIVNPDCTIASVKSLMGKTYKDVEPILSRFSYKVVSGSTGLPEISIGGRNRTPEEISSATLRKLKHDAEEYLGKEITGAVITVPAYFGNVGRQATKDAAEIAGIKVLRIINEPTAASIAYGLDNLDGRKENNIVVYDFGGGTLDISILVIADGVYEVKSTSGNSSLGGDDIDERLTNYLVKEFKREHNIDLRKDLKAYQRVKEAAENAKKELSSSTSTRISIPYIVLHDGNPKNLDITITRVRFEALIDDLIEKTMSPCRDALKKSGIEKKDIHEVLLVGGSTRIPCVQERVASFFGRKLSKNINPDEAVALGAAIQASVLVGKSKKNVVLLDVTPLKLGLETLGGVFTEIIPENTTVPCKKSQIFSTAQDNQVAVTITVSQGMRPLAADNQNLGLFNLVGIEPKPRGVPRIEVSFDINSDGILEVTAKDKDTNKEQSIRIEGSGNLNKEEVERMKADAKKYEEEDKKKGTKITKLNEADSYILTAEKELREHGDKVSKDVSEPLREFVEKMKDAHRKEDMKLLESCKKELLEKMQTFMKVVSEQKDKPSKAEEVKGGKKEKVEVEEAKYEEVKEEEEKKKQD